MVDEPTQESVRPDRWATLADAKREAAVVAGYARTFYGDSLKSVWLYGSRARQDHRPDSDLDVLLVRNLRDDLDSIATIEDLTDQPFREFLEERMESYSVLFTPIQIHSVEPDQLDSWDTMFFRSVRDDGIRIL
ncbi:MAG: nucleotidyltransferase domain-containing protein [bacterium]|nr:nucleotidyltransferase domain-containing protein [bacterium]MDE0290181.1 nucleotidyltransferase domain-containing protein [bacterium]MDE0437454.1 nucleotidyltransferase domain-containing protein [bacterium]